MRKHLFSKRLIKPELLDHCAPEEARANLKDLVQINERFGGHSVIRRVLARVAERNDRFTLLDVGSASGDTGRFIRHLYPNASVTNLDYSVVNADDADQPKLVADAFYMPFAPGSFDFVLSSLFLHHFTDEQVKALLRAFHATARKAVLVCDLERHVLPYFFLPLTKLLFGWNRITVHDGIISVRASFRAPELLKLTRDAGMERAEVEVHRPAFRISVVARKNGI